ncbi:heavy-metal-associated domain-containing protein [Streptomyces capparidis]
MSSSCCTPEGTCHTASADNSATDGVTTVYAVSGMSCGHCRTAITEAVGGLDGVLSVDVDVTGGKVTVTTAAAPDDSLIAKAIDEAGYELTGRAA